MIHFFITAPVEQLVMNKSSLHLELEQALKENKQTIFRMPSNSSDLYELRRQAANLTRALSVEIRREYQQEQQVRKF